MVHITSLSLNFVMNREKVKSFVLWRLPKTTWSFSKNNASLSVCSYTIKQEQIPPFNVTFQDTLTSPKAVQIAFTNPTERDSGQRKKSSPDIFNVDQIFLISEIPFTLEDKSSQCFVPCTVETFHSFFSNSLSNMIEGFLNPGINNGIIALKWLCQKNSVQERFPKEISVQEIFLSLVSHAKPTTSSTINDSLPTVGNICFISPSSQQAFYQPTKKNISSNDQLSSSSIFSKQCSPSTPPPPLFFRCILGICLFVSIDSLQPVVFDSLSPNLTPLTLAPHSFLDCVEIHRVTFLHLRSPSCLVQYFSTIEDNRKKLPFDRRFATVFSLYSDTCRNNSHVPLSQLCRFTFLEIEMVAYDANITTSLTSLVDLVNKRPRSEKGFFRCQDPFSCILQDLLGGISKIMFLTCFDTVPQKLLLEIASQASQIWTSPRIMSFLENNIVARYIKKWDTLVTRLYEDPTVLCIKQALNQTCLKLTGVPVELTQIIDCLFNCESLDAALLKCRNILSRGTGYTTSVDLCSVVSKESSSFTIDPLYDRDASRPQDNSEKHTTRQCLIGHVDDSSSCVVTPQKKNKTKREMLNTCALPKFSLEKNWFNQKWTKNSVSELEGKMFPKKSNHPSPKPSSTNDTLHSFLSTRVSNVMRRRDAMYLTRMASHLNQKGQLTHCAGALPRTFPCSSATDYKEKPQDNRPFHGEARYEERPLYASVSPQFNVFNSKRLETSSETFLNVSSSGFYPIPFPESSNESPLHTTPSSTLVKPLNCPAVYKRRHLREPISSCDTMMTMDTKSLRNKSRWTWTEHIVRRHFNAKGMVYGPLCLSTNEYLKEPLPCPLIRRSENA